MKIIFRTNGGKNIGLGHVYRCISLAQAMKESKKDIKIVFVSNIETKELIEENQFEFIPSNSFDGNDLFEIKKLGPDLIVFDSYLADNQYLRRLKNVSKLVIFDDNNDIYDSSIPDLIINGNLHALKLNYINKEKHLLGPKYLVMKKEYWKNQFENASHSLKNNRKNSTTLMITTGGTDSNKVMIRLIKVLKDFDMKKKVIIGPLYEDKYIEDIKNEISDNLSFELIYKPKSLKKYIENSDYVLTAAGSTVYEVLTLKKIPIIYTLAENQELIAKELENYGIINLGNYNNLDYTRIKKIIEDVVLNKASLNRKVKYLFDIFDAQGAKRVAEKLIGEIYQ